MLLGNRFLFFHTPNCPRTSQSPLVSGDERVDEAADVSGRELAALDEVGELGALDLLGNLDAGSGLEEAGVGWEADDAAVAAELGAEGIAAAAAELVEQAALETEQEGGIRWLGSGHGGGGEESDGSDDLGELHVD
jgi:hypothetical protein